MNINKVFFGGRITKDLELRYIPSGTAVVSFSMVSNRKQDGKDVPTFVEVTAWGRTAESLCQYKGKGDILFVEGSLKQDTWEDKETGKKRSKIRITAERVEFVTGKKNELETDDTQKSTGGSFKQEAISDDDVPF